MAQVPPGNRGSPLLLPLLSVVKSASKWVPNLPSPSTLSHCRSSQVQDADKIGSRNYFSKEVHQERLTLLPGSELEV